MATWDGVRKTSFQVAFPIDFMDSQNITALAMCAGIALGGVVLLVVAQSAYSRREIVKLIVALLLIVTGGWLMSISEEKRRQLETQNLDFEKK